MARSRIAAMSASCVLALGATLGSAQAQSPGAPLPILQIDHAGTAVHSHRNAPARTGKSEPARKVVRRHVARRVAAPAHSKTRMAGAGRALAATPSQTAPQNGSQAFWPTPTTAALGYAATPKPMDAGTPPPAPATASAAVRTEQVVDTDPNAILNGGHTVPAAMPAPLKPAPGTPKRAAATASPPAKTASAAAATAKPAVRAMLVKPSRPSPVGSASWIAQLLAALGGAIAAGAVAWFLIRPAPERNYG